MVIFILLMFINISLMKADYVDESAENKYINNLPDEEKREFLEKVARRILEEVKSNEAEAGLKSGEINDDKLDVHGEYIKKLLKEETENLKRRNHDKNNTVVAAKKKSKSNLRGIEALGTEGKKHGKKKAFVDFTFRSQDSEKVTDNSHENTKLQNSTQTDPKLLLDSTTLRSSNAKPDQPNLQNENKKEISKQIENTSKNIDNKNPVSIEITFVNDEDENLKKNKIPVNVIYDNNDVEKKSNLTSGNALPINANKKTVAKDEKKMLFRKSYSADMEDDLKNDDLTSNNQMARRKRKSNSEVASDVESSSTTSHQTNDGVATDIAEETESQTSSYLNLKLETTTEYQDTTSIVAFETSTESPFIDKIEAPALEKEFQKSQDDSLQSISTISYQTNNDENTDIGKEIESQTSSDLSLKLETTTEYQDKTSIVAVENSTQIPFVDKLETATMENEVQQSKDDNLTSKTAREIDKQTIANDPNANKKMTEAAVIENISTTTQEIDHAKSKLNSKENYDNSTSADDGDVHMNKSTENLATESVSPIELNVNTNLSTNKSEIKEPVKLKAVLKETEPTSTKITDVVPISAPKIVKKNEIVAMEAPVEILKTFPKSNDDKNLPLGGTNLKKLNPKGSSGLREYIVFEIPRGQQPFAKKKPIKGQPKKGKSKVEQFVPNQSQSFKQEQTIQPSQVEEPYYAPVYNYAPEFAYFNPKNKYGPNLDDEVKIVDERSHEVENNELEKVFDYDFEKGKNRADNKEKSNIKFQNKVSKTKLTPDTLVRTGPTIESNRIQISNHLREKIRHRLQNLKDRYGMADARTGPVISTPDDKSYDNTITVQVGRINDYKNNYDRKTKNKKSNINIIADYIADRNKRPINIQMSSMKNYVKQGKQKQKHTKILLAIQKLLEYDDNLKTGLLRPAISSNSELGGSNRISDPANVVIKMISKSKDNHFQQKHSEKDKKQYQLYNPAENPSKGYDTVADILSKERNIEPYVTVMTDLIQTNSKAFDNYNWLTTTVDIRSALVKLIDLCEKIKNNDKNMHEKDLQLFKYILYLYSTTKFLNDDQIIPSLWQKANPNLPDPKPSALKKMAKNGREDVPLTPRFPYLKDSLEISKDKFVKGSKGRSRRFKGKIQKRYGLRRDMQRPWLNKRGLKDMAIDLGDFLEDLGAVLYDFHNAIQHISLVTNYRHQRWFENLKEVYLSSPPTRKQVLEIILHLETTRLIDLIENSAASGLVENYVKYGLENPKEVDRTKDEFAFVVKLYLELKKLQ